MCTYIVHSTQLAGAGKGTTGWFKLNRATVGYDHPVSAEAEHAILLDFTKGDGDLTSRVAVELDLESGRALLQTLSETIAEAEASGV